MTTKKTTPEVNTVSQRIYIGPPFNGINRNTAFLNGLPPQFKKYEKSTALRGLLVNVEDFIKAQNEINQAGSYINCMYNKFSEEIKK